jgi:outer membrane protein assembly factor BamB
MIRARILLTSLLAAAALAAVPASASADFGFLGDWGTTGDQNGQFQTPTFIDVAPDGSVWVAENDKRVQKFTADGQYLTQVQVGHFGAGPVAVDGAGNLYVGNRDTYQIMKFDPGGAPLGAFGSQGTAAGQFQDICGLDADAAGNFYVSDGRGGYCDSAPRVQKFDPNGALLKEIKLTAKTDPDGVGDIAVAGDGTIFVADPTNFGNHEIFKLTPDGALAGRFGSKGTGPAQFGQRGPESIALAPDGTLYALDAENHRVQHLGADGAFLGQFGAANAFRGVAVAPAGDVYVTRGRQSVPTPENANTLGVDRVLRFGQDAPPAPPATLTLSPSVKITVGGPVKCAGLKDPETGKAIKDCTGYRQATIEWSAGCPAQGPLTRRSAEVTLPHYTQVEPKRLPVITGSAADSGSFTVVLRPGSKVTPQIEAGCVAYTQPDGEPVSAKGSAKGNTAKTAPVVLTGFAEYSRSPRGVLLGNFRGKKVKGPFKAGKEVRLFWGARYDDTLAGGKNKSIRIHIVGAGLNVNDYLHAYQLEDYGPRLLIKPRKRGQIKVWATVGGVRSVNTVTLRAA